MLWPALLRSLDDGEELTARVEREHQEITELVAALEQSTPDDPKRPQLIDRTIAVLRQDVREEEDVLLPRLQAAVDTRTLRRLGVAWELVRRTTPTRTHPIVSRRPPGQTLSALPLSATDRLRDGLDHAARRAPQPARPAVVSASNGLGAVARRIEQLPPLRRGERAETTFNGQDHFGEEAAVLPRHPMPTTRNGLSRRADRTTSSTISGMSMRCECA